mgnify:CR=1 FL=1
MITEQENKLVNLAEDIINNGLNPSDIPIVTPSADDEKAYVVLEGNRRVTAIKLIIQPDLVPSEFSFIKRRFKEF